MKITTPKCVRAAPHQPSDIHVTLSLYTVCNGFGYSGGIDGEIGGNAIDGIWAMERGAWTLWTSANLVCPSEVSLSSVPANSDLPRSGQIWS